MSTRDRRQREFAERERLFLTTTRELICQEGLLQTQMARIAEACDYATGTLYQHFASKEDLLVALLADCAEERIALFKRAAAWEATTRDRMFAFAVADVAFVKRNPEYFRIEQFVQTEVVWSLASPARRCAYLDTLAPVSALALGIIEDAVACGDLDAGRATPEEIAFGLWAEVEGTHSLAHTQGLLDLFEIEEPYRLMCRNIHRLLNELGWKPLVDVSRGADCDADSQRLLGAVFGQMCADETGQPRKVV
jgi:AcrR family transcriptional regulator